MKSAISDLILRNFWLKFFSVALAAVIWLGIHYGIRNEFSIGQLNINNLLAQEYVKVPVAVVITPGDLQKSTSWKSARTPSPSNRFLHSPYI
jgi:hypothetical protein